MFARLILVLGLLVGAVFGTLGGGLLAFSACGDAGAGSFSSTRWRCPC